MKIKIFFYNKIYYFLESTYLKKIILEKKMQKENFQSH